MCLGAHPCAATHARARPPAHPPAHPRAVNVTTLMDTEQRTRMVLDRIAYETDPDTFIARCAWECVGVGAGAGACGWVRSL